MDRCPVRFRFGLAFAVIWLQVMAAGTTLHAQQGEQPLPQQPTTQQPAQQQQQQPPPQQPPAASSGTPSFTDLISIDHIRKELERRPALTFSMADPNLPVYRLRIEGYRFQLPTWQQNFVIARSPVPVPLGGGDYYEMQRLITPTDVWAVQNRDALGMLQTQLESSLAMMLIRKAIAARKDAEPSRARAEVQQELADIAAHNARVAAGQADDGTEADAKKKAEEKKKQDEEKKKKATKKKDGDGP